MKEIEIVDQYKKDGVFYIIGRIDGDTIKMYGIPGKKIQYIGKMKYWAAAEKKYAAFWEAHSAQ